MSAPAISSSQPCMFSVADLVVAPDAVPFNLELAAGVVQVIENAHPDLGRGLVLLRRPRSGRIVFAGQDLTRLNDGAMRKLRRRLQYVGGDPRLALLPHQTVSRALDEPARIHKLAGTANRDRAASLTASLGISSALHSRPIETLSTVMRWRVLVARALILEPDVLIVDAPSAYSAPTLLSDLLADLTAARGTAAVVWLGPTG